VINIDVGSNFIRFASNNLTKYKQLFKNVDVLFVIIDTIINNNNYLGGIL